jgi:dolichol kinase
VNAFFFPEVTKFFSVQVRIIARAGASARAKLFVRLGTSLCFKTRATETRFYTMEIFLSFTRIILYTFRKIPYNFFLCCARISSIMNAKKISKFEREEKSNGNPLPHHGFFFFSLTRIILYTFRKIPYNFFLCCARISRIMNAKKISKFEREEKSNGNPLLHHGIFLSFHEKFPIYIQKDS